MRKLNNHTYRLLWLILALTGLMSVAIPMLEPVALAQSPVTNPGWTSTGSLTTNRSCYTATLLANGKVLVMGGYNLSTFLNSAELYDPATGAWSLTGNLNQGRSNHTATLLPNGKVLVAGGRTSHSYRGDPINTAELYDPTTGTWSLTGNLNIASLGHTTTLLQNGQVLVVGGQGADGFFGEAERRAEVYDPATGRWSLTGNLIAGRNAHTMTLLANGQVLVLGGFGGDPWNDLYSAELYDPTTGMWSRTGNLSEGRTEHTATLLANGQVLVTGGYSGWVIGPPPLFDEIHNMLSSAELYDPATGRWNRANPIFAPNAGHTATLLANGRVLVAGVGSYLYDPSTGTSNLPGNFYDATDFGNTAMLLPNGQVLTTGVFRGAYLFDLGSSQSGTVSSVSSASYRLLGLASEAIAASFGNDLATMTSRATTLPLPTSLAGTTVMVKDSTGAERIAPLFFVSPTQVNYQIPAGTAAGAATVTITSVGGGGAVFTGVALIHKVAPSLFTANASGQGVAAAIALRVKADGSRSYEPIAQFDAAQNRFVARPLDLGPEGEQVFLLLFGTGIRHRSSLSAVIATIGGAYAELSFAGAQGDFVGLDQINVPVPRSLAGRGEVDVLLTVEAQMANAVRVNIK